MVIAYGASFVIVIRGSLFGTPELVRGVRVKN